ncbi:MAG: NADH-quinone oxidoreductase subunit N [Acidobacteriota bacterium]
MNNLAAEAQVFLPAVLPLLLLSLGASGLALFAGAGREGRKLVPPAAFGILIATWVVAWRGLATVDAGPLAPYHGFIHHDRFAIFATLLFAGGAALVTILHWRYADIVHSDHPETYALTLFAACGMIVMAAASDLLTLFIGIEVLSLALYALCGLPRTHEATEAAIKYFLMGAFASGFFLMGAAFVFGASGTTHYDAFLTPPSTLLLAGGALLLASVAFKLGLPPFHMWAPDAYQGAPSSVTAYMAFGTKAAMAMALVRLVRTTGLGLAPEVWHGVAVALAVTAMFWGNTVALAQGHLRRLVAYSSIAHAGVVFLGIATGTKMGATAVLFYLVAYTFAIVGFFGVVVALRLKGHEVVNVRDLAGLSRKSPVLSSLLALFLISLAGFPPTAGFFAKFAIFRSAVDAGLTGAAIAGALASAIGVFYYLYIVVTMFMKTPAEDATPVDTDLSPALAAALVVAFGGTLPLGLFPEALMRAAERAIQSLG